MTDTAEAIDVSGSIDDAQIDKFFESGGNEELLPAENASEESTQQQQQQEVNQEQAQTQAQAQEKEQAQKQEKMVPYGAMHEERMRRQELQREIENYKQRTEKMEQAFQQVLQRANAPQERVPTFEEDPLEALRYNQNEIAKVLQSQNQTLEEQRAAAVRHAQLSQFQDMCNQSVADFEKTAPDYKQAYQWLVEQELKGFETLGYDQKTAIKLLRDNEMALAATAFKEGFNPAERIYNYAKLRGFQLPSAPKQINEVDQITKKLETIEKGIQASRSLGSAGGGTSQPLTLAALANMDGDELDEILGKDWEKLMKQG